MIAQGKTISTCLWMLVLVFVITGCSGGGADDETAATGVVELDAGPVPIEEVQLVRDGDGNIVGQTVTLDGSRSGGPLAPLTYSWSFASKPYGSEAQLANPDSVSTSFVVDVAGTYMVQLVVNDGTSSDRDVAIVLVTVTNEGPTIPFHHVGLGGSHCADCHNGFNRNAFTSELVIHKSGDHLATSNMCQACHTPFGFDIIPIVDHQEVFGSCSSCHNGALAIGKSDFHIETNAECDDCHNTTSFVQLELDGSFDHTGIVRGCVGCHNGITAVGKDANHLITDSDCAYCHNTVSFLEGYVDHSLPPVVGNRCDFCHGSTAVGKSPNHPVTAVDCGICHNVFSFNLGGVFQHRVVDAQTQPCVTCHDGNHVGAGARGATDTDIHRNAAQADTGCESCHNTEDFRDAFVDHTSLEVVSQRCDACHNDGNNNITGVPYPNHVPVTTEDCDVCHTPGGTFATGVFDHTAVEADLNVLCTSCHNEVITAGKSANHIPTGQDCRTCHGTTTFVGATVDHTSILDGCATCHDGVITIGKPQITHVPAPANLDCSTCHVGGTATPVFVPAGNFSHQDTVTAQGCSGCHNGQFIAEQGDLKGKPRTTHIPTIDDCDTCHSTTAYSPATYTHTSTTGCGGCHNGRFTTGGKILGKPTSAADHVPTTQDCHFCHDSSGWVSSVQSVFAHTGITGNCRSCHNVTYDGIGATMAPDTAIHTANPSTDCGACHSVTAFTPAFVDHSGITGNCTVGCHVEEKAYAESTAHTSPTNGNDCELCHIGGGTWVEAVFDHTNISATRRCDECHNGVQATGKEDRLTRTGLPHPTTTEDCRVCHNTTTFAGAQFNHQGISSGCVDCHDGVTAIGKHDNHVPTSQDCSVCHRTTGFVPGTFDHVANQITGNCSSCHNDRFATGKSTGHVSTTADCGVCHNTNTFTGATFDHSTIGNQACGGCHNKPQDHPQTNLDCDSCHTTATFLGATWVHDASTAGRCLDCHFTGRGATPQPTQGHFVTTLQCDRCHTTSSWADQGTFDHCPGTTANSNACGTYPGDHRAGKTACVDCHAQNRESPISYPNNSQYAPACAGCHAGDFKREGDHIGGSNGTVEQNKNCGASGCHRVSGNGF